MKEFLADNTGTHALEHVVAITPLHNRGSDGKRTLATLHMAGGQFFHTDTDYDAALSAWGVEPEPAPAK